MNSKQKELLVTLGYLVYTFAVVVSGVNAVFDNRLWAELLPVGLVAVPLIVRYIQLGKEP